MIEEYFLKLELIIREVITSNSLFIKKKIYSSKQGYISGTIIFENNCRLDFVEVKDIDVKAKIKYSYHYMDEKQNPIFRYDNAPHHSDIETFPHHKHEADNIKSSVEPELYNILLEILQRQRNYETNS